MAFDSLLGDTAGGLLADAATVANNYVASSTGDSAELSPILQAIGATGPAAAAQPTPASATTKQPSPVNAPKSDYPAGQNFFTTHKTALIVAGVALVALVVLGVVKVRGIGSMAKA